MLAITATVASCSSPAEETPAGADTSPVESGEDATGGEQPDAAAGHSSDDVGNASLTVNGVEFLDFVGDCEITRETGKKDVGDLNEGDITTIIAIDNVAAHEESSMSYVAISEESFTFRDPVGAAGVGGPRAKGEITTMTELGPRTADGSRDIVEVRFAGVLEDGTTVDADIVCELQNAF